MSFYNNEEDLDLESIDPDSLPGGVPEGLIEIWRSKLYLVRHYSMHGVERLSIDYTVHELNDNVDTIKWDTLQQIKSRIGFGDRWAVELFPADDEEDHSIRYRHLWLVDRPDSLIFSPKEGVA